MAFSGTATYDIYATEIGEDVSDLVSMISPTVTPFLDAIGDSSMPFSSPYYTWEEKNLLPDSFVMSSAISSTAAASGGIEVGANANLLRVGDILMATAGARELYMLQEHMQERLLVLLPQPQELLSSSHQL